MEKLIALFGKAVQSPKFKASAASGGAIVDDLRGPALAHEVNEVQKSLNEVAKKVFVEKKQ